MEVLLGSPPPPPPPNVPALEETKGTADSGRALTVRERMEQHRSNPQCTSCHRVIDPLGLALENFDATGKWRIRDGGMTVDTKGQLFDGTAIEGPDGLRDALLRHKDVVLLSFTRSLMTYALGRRVEAFDMPAVRRIIRDAEAQNYRISAFVNGIVESDAFRMAKLPASQRSDDDRYARTGAPSSHVHHPTESFAAHRAQGHWRDDRAAVPRRHGAGGGARRKAASRCA